MDDRQTAERLAMRTSDSLWQRSRLAADITEALAAARADERARALEQAARWVVCDPVHRGEPCPSGEGCIFCELAGEIRAPHSRGGLSDE